MSADVSVCVFIDWEVAVRELPDERIPVREASVGNVPTRELDSAELSDGELVVREPSTAELSPGDAADWELVGSELAVPKELFAVEEAKAGLHVEFPEDDASGTSDTGLL